MLKEPTRNPHATLLTLYMNAVDEMAFAETRQAIAAEYKRAELYIFNNGRSPAAFSNPYSKESILLGASRTLFRDGDAYFNRSVLFPRRSKRTTRLHFSTCPRSLPHKSDTNHSNTKR